MCRGVGLLDTDPAESVTEEVRLMQNGV
jgi:hypothetical protein